MIRIRLAAALLSLASFTALAPAQTIVVHGHRGARALRPENTLPAFEYAIAQGVDVLELDLAVTKDNVLVVSHYPSLKASFPGERVCTGPELKPETPIRTMTLAEVKQYDCGATANPRFPKQVAVPGTKVPTFDEVLALADHATGSSFQFNVETKSFPNHPELTPTPAEFVRLIVEAVKRHKLEPRIILQSFDFRTLAEMKKQDPAIRLSALVSNSKYDAMMGITDPDKDFGSIARKTGANIVSPDTSLVTAEQVAAAHKAGAEVAPYTINDPAEWQRLVDCKVDAIITDDPAALLAWLRAKNPPLHK